MRPLLVTSEPSGVARGSGTAVAAANLVEALAANGVALAVLRASDHPLGHSGARLRLNRAAALAAPAYDAYLGIGGDGQAAAAVAGVPFVALPKALYAEVRRHERGLTRALLGGHAALEGRAARAASLVITGSRAAASAVHHDYGVSWARIEVIPEPFPVQRWRAALPAPRRSGRHALLVAHLYPRKRAIDAVAAWPEVRRRRPGAILDIAGDGPELGALRRAAAATEGVRLHGHLPPHRVARLYARADVAISASAHETFGYAVLEALAAGLPVVAASAPAVVELCEGAVAERVAVGYVAGLGRAIARSLDPGVAAAAAAVNPALASRSESAAVGAAYLAALERLCR